MSIRNNYPTVNPTLDLDFANTRRLDPRVTFTRSSTATYYDGSKALAEQNLLLNSQTFNTTWVASSITFATGITDPLGTTTAYTATASGANATVYQSVIIPADTFTFSIYIQRVTGTGTINLTLDGTTMTVASVTGSWVRYTATQALTAGTYTVGIQIVTSGDAVNIWGAQLEQRSSASAYNVTTTSIVANYISVLKTAAINQPRFDVDPVTGESKGLLIEEQRTNLLTYSEQFDNAVWVKSPNATATANVITAPDGTITCDKISYLGSSTAPQQTVSSLTTTYSFSAFVKKGNTSFCRLRLGATVGGSGTSVSVHFNIDTGVVSAVGATTADFGAITASITQATNGFYRISITFTVLTATTSIAYSIIAAQVSGGGSSNGDEIYIWGAQVEVGAFPTSYIPTTSASVTRAADNASMTGTAFSSWYNQSEGTVIAEADYSSTSAYSTVFDVNNGTSANRMRIIGWNDGTEKQIITESTILQAQFNNTSTTAPFKSTISYSLNNIAGSRNGNTPQTDNTALIPSVNQMQLGSFNLTQFYLNGHIKTIRYYPARVSNAQLQALTSI